MLGNPADPVDPGELALAVYGMHQLIEGPSPSGTWPRFGIEKLREVGTYEDRLLRHCRVITEPTDETPEYDQPGTYLKLLERLSDPITPQSVQALIRAFPVGAQDVSGPFILCANRAWEYLRSIFPTMEYQSFAGPETITPDDDSIWSFLVILWPLADPMIIPDLIAIGGVLDIQVAAMRHVYPTLSTLLDQDLYQVVAERRAQKESYHLPVQSEDGLSTWFARDMSVADPSEPSLNKSDPVQGSPAPGGPNLSTPVQKASQA